MMRALVAGGADPKLAMPNGANALLFAAGLGWRNGSPAAPSYDQGSDEEAVEAIRFLLGLGFDIHGTNDSRRYARSTSPFPDADPKPSSHSSSRRAPTPK